MSEEVKVIEEATEKTEETAKKGWFKRFVMPAFALLAVAAYPSLFMYFTNVTESNLPSIFETAGLFILMAFAGTFFVLIFYRNFSKSAFIGCITMLVLLNFKFLRDFFPYYLMAAIIFGLLLIGLFVLVWKKLTAATSQTLNIFFAAIFTALILFNGVMAAPTIYKKVTYQKTDFSVSAKGKDKDAVRPNVYYFIFDEYANFDNSKILFDYDNADFLQFLKDKKFNVSMTSKNRTAYTNFIVPDLMNLREVITQPDMTITQADSYMKDPYLFKLMRSYNYKQNTINYGGYLDESGSDFRYEQGIESDITNSISKYIYEKTFLFPLTTKILADTNEEEWSKSLVQNVYGQLNYAKNSYKLGLNNVFTMGFFSLPHSQFIFKADGGPVAHEDSDDWRNPNNYFEQFKYTTTLMEDLLSSIIENDPNCVIIVQSDHSCRLRIHQRDRFQIPIEDFPAEMENIRACFNTVYYMGEELDIEGLSGTNTLIEVTNKLLGENTPRVPDTMNLY